MAAKCWDISTIRLNWQITKNIIKLKIQYICIYSNMYDILVGVQHFLSIGLKIVMTNCYINNRHPVDFFLNNNLILLVKLTKKLNMKKQF